MGRWGNEAADCVPPPIELPSGARGLMENRRRDAAQPPARGSSVVWFASVARRQRGRHTSFVTPGMATGYLPSGPGKIGGSASKVYCFGERSSFDAIASSHVIRLPV